MSDLPELKYGFYSDKRLREYELKHTPSHPRKIYRTWKYNPLIDEFESTGWKFSDSDIHLSDEEFSNIQVTHFDKFYNPIKGIYKPR
mgnify:CR=1 FL=1|tara:strand:+ start:136 stop:396 length:261 start_codon:yes stop_codon:yes gene_type:complete